MRVRTLILVAGLISAAACGSDDGGQGLGDENPDGDVFVRNDFFDPADLTVEPGATVVWAWASSGRLHNIDFDDAPPSGDQGSGTFERTFATAGDFPYHCAIHGPSMNGVIHVVAASEGDGGSAGGGGGGAGGGGGYPAPSPGGY